jgi:hypothetical protein
MYKILKNFITESLFDASASMLDHLKIKFSPQTKAAISFDDLYFGTTSSAMPKTLADVVAKVDASYIIGSISEDSLMGRHTEVDLSKPLEGKYQTMLVFAVKIKPSSPMTRTEQATLVRGFNRMASSLPVIVFILNDNRLSLATCERTNYKQDWRIGEKLGKVSILRNINCEDPHRGHIDILESIGDKEYPTFDQLYEHWREVFSSELLTQNFYKEISEWYAWVIGSGKVKFPNDLNTTEDDTKYNHENTIRLITRLIFVWFLKRKKLVPDDFFDEETIKNNFIENFDPHSKQTLLYNPEDSKYYRLILQNLFFAMLNRPIKDEESNNTENRRFRSEETYHGINKDCGINNLLRYRKEFMPGGAEKLLQIANSCVPFLNGGLFECLDRKSEGLYYDGFSERKASLEQLCFPDYFFFGNEVGSNVDLSTWYDDETQKHVKVHGIIDILKSYNFTVEESTPLDQEVSLDPELLGKVFENLLASYNPETNTTARKQTGSFYTPREIVNYMVDESLVAHLERKCPEIDESVFRNLLRYSVDEINIDSNQRKEIISALYNCKILDPACGSGAFPMGMLQQMVHVLRKLDPTNEMWREFILELALEKDKEAYTITNESERKKVRSDIEEAFNRNVNDPDYARKLYLIDNCIYGVDIQPIATQISKLRFFISLVADQNPTNDALKNFGIRPLPNLEAKFVSANTLIPLGEDNIFTGIDEIREIKKQLGKANHKLFRVKFSEKRVIRQQIKDIRSNYADKLYSVGAVDIDGAMKLAKWEMFDQNCSADFFDVEWMFAHSDGFDIVIANPPYVVTRKGLYKGYNWNTDLYKMFFERTCKLSNCFVADRGVVCFITPKFYLLNKDDKDMRKYFMTQVNLNSLALCNPFDAVTENVITIFTKEKPLHDSIPVFKYDKEEKEFKPLPNLSFKYSLSNENYEMIVGLTETTIKLLDKIKQSNVLLRNISISKRGAEVGKKFLREQSSGCPALIGMDTSKYEINWADTYLPYSHKEYIRLSDFFKEPLVYIRRVDSCLTATMSLSDKVFAFSKNLYGLLIKDHETYPNEFIVGWLNSKVVDFYYKKRFSTKKEEAFPEIQTYLYEQLPLPLYNPSKYQEVGDLVKRLLGHGYSSDVDRQSIINHIDIFIYKLYDLSYDELKIVDPETSITEEEYNNYE